MPVTYLELENFKSYAGLQRIGPFMNFTSIIGPNGSGKSNVMDALSFVLGVQSRDLRSSQMKDLIFRPPGTSKRNAKKLKASAALYYQSEPKNDDNKDDTESKGSHEETSTTTTKFQRTISASGVGEYRVDGKTVSFKEYEERLADIGVLVKARNFLVFQGDVESLARKSPQEFVQLFEEISQSIELKDAYEKALKEKEEAEASTLFCYNKQKGMKGERRMLKEQKEEAERFHQLLEKKQKLQTDLYLWLLYHMDVDRKQRETTLQELSAELTEKEAAEQQDGEALKAAKKKASAARRQTQAADNRRVQVATEVDRLEPSIIQTTEEIKTIKKKLKQDQAQLEKKKEQAKTHTDKLKTLDEDIAQAKSGLEGLEKEYEEIKRDAAPGDVTLTNEQEQEYERVKEAAAAASVEPRRALAMKQKQLESSRAKAADLALELKDAQERKAEIEREVNGLKERSTKLSNSMEKTESDCKAAEKTLREGTQAAEQAERRRQELDTELEKINATLREARDDRHKNKDEERLLQAIESLKRHFPGVHGRLVDLCRPTQRRFNLAVTVAAGKDMDAIVVDSKSTGLECIRYLREQRVGTATFLPLDNIQVPTLESAERIRARISEDGRYRLAADVMTCDESMKKAILYAVGNTVVCDDLTAARQLCFEHRNRNDDAARVKAVTLGGAVISKAGTMTGGVTAEDNSRAGRWDDRAIQQLRSKKEKLEEERAELDKSGGSGRQSLGHSSQIEELRNNFQHLRNRMEYSKSDLEFTRKQLAEKKILLKSVERKLPSIQEAVRTTEETVEKLNGQTKEAIAAVKQAEDEHLAPFRAATGLQDLHAYDQAIRQSRDEYNKKRRAMVEHITHLEQQRNYETNRDLMQPISKLEKRIKENQQKLKAAETRAKEVEALVNEAKEKVKEAEVAAAEASKVEEELEKKVLKAQSDFSESQAERGRLSKAVTAEEAALERLRGKLHETLQKARVEEVDLPMIDSDSSSKKSLSRKTRSGRSLGGDNDEENESSSEEQGPRTQESGGLQMTQFSQEDNPKVVQDRNDIAKVDFSGMHPDLKQPLGDREERKVRKDFDEQRVKLEAELEGMTPNMKAHDAFDTVTSKLKESCVDFDKAKEKARKASANFQQIKVKRAKRFNDAFHHIDKALKSIYTDMTKSSKHPLGGNAYLSLDDTEEPYKGGLKFNAMPPMKRFRDMEQLSGGEKTVAALSLLFAIHSFRPAPFFVMDEVDAALDNINLRKVCNYIQQRSQVDFQCIVISLKDMFYERSEGLIGICRDVGTSSSRTITLDLSKYDKAEVEEPPERQRSKRPRRAVSEGGGPSRKRQALPSSPASVVSQ